MVSASFLCMNMWSSRLAFLEKVVPHYNKKKLLLLEIKTNKRTRVQRTSQIVEIARPLKFYKNAETKMFGTNRRAGKGGQSADDSWEILAQKKSKNP